jgi:hypothetical protein
MKFLTAIALAQLDPTAKANVTNRVEVDTRRGQGFKFKSDKIKRTSTK